jgi:hypothetical protein
MTIKLFLLILLLISFKTNAQKKWAGPANGNWEDAQNWHPQGVPANPDDVILDNTYQKNNYKVAMPNATVNVHTLYLEPAAGNNVEVIIPATNKASPALIINDPGTSFNIRSGGIFRNSSGLLSGESIQVSGLVSIYNGGRYIHNSRSSHATEIVARLSTAPGTEKGVFEFDVPGGSYPISISNRIYGTLVLSSDASGGTQTYNASGSNQVIINGDFQINDGVQFNLDLTKDMVINADYIQKGGVFNIASQANNNTVQIKGDISQSTSATITETSGGLPVIELCGDHKQLVSFAGHLLNSIALKINNQQGIMLISPLVLPYKLQLMAGTVKTGKANLLTLLDNSTVSGGSGNSFVDGPLRKIGDDDFEFPVGKQGDYAPLKITGSGGSITDEYVGAYYLGSPQQLYGNSFESPPVVRISAQEYWVLERASGSSSKKITVFVGNYSNATDLGKLVIVRWDAANNLWKNEGNSFYSGIATGTLVSNDVKIFGAFTLGSTVIMQNPLLVNAVKPDAVRGTGKRLPDINFKIFPSPVTSNAYLQLQAAQNDLVTIVITEVGGRQVRVLKIALFKGFNNIPVESDHLAKGVYFFCLYDKIGRFLEAKKVIRL